MQQNRADWLFKNWTYRVLAKADRLPKITNVAYLSSPSTQSLAEKVHDVFLSMPEVYRKAIIKEYMDTSYPVFGFEAYLRAANQWLSDKFF